MVKTTSSRDTLEARPIPGQRRGATAGGPLAWGQSAVGAVGPPPRLSPRALHALSESIPTAGRRLVPPPPEVRDLPNATPLAPNVNPTHPQRPPARASAPPPASLWTTYGGSRRQGACGGGRGPLHRDLRRLPCRRRPLRLPPLPRVALPRRVRCVGGDVRPS